MTLDARIEAVLFATAQSLSVKRLSELLETDATKIREALVALSKRLEDSEQGPRQESGLVDRLGHADRQTPGPLGMDAQPCGPPGERALR